MEGNDDVCLCSILWHRCPSAVLSASVRHSVEVFLFNIHYHQNYSSTWAISHSFAFFFSLSLLSDRERERRKDTQNVIFPIPSLVRLFFEKDKRFLHGRRQCQQHAIPLSSFPSLAASLFRPPTFVKKLVLAVLSLSFPVGRSLARSLASISYNVRWIIDYRRLSHLSPSRKDDSFRYRRDEGTRREREKKKTKGETRKREGGRERDRKMAQSLFWSRREKNRLAITYSLNIGISICLYIYISADSFATNDLRSLARVKLVWMIDDGRILFVRLL